MFEIFFFTVVIPQQNILLQKIKNTSFLFSSLDCSCDPSCTDYENCYFPGLLYSIVNHSSYIDHVKTMSENNVKMVNECLYPLSPQPYKSSVKLKFNAGRFG